MPKNHISVHVCAEVDTRVDVDLDELMGDLSENDFAALINRSGQYAGHLTRVYEEFRRRGDAPQILKDYIYEVLGKVLP